ncbi:ribonuclease H-like protein [Rickenella mellea]|uniref:Ribonuclease H-like protein n=1 Tax=Rickenella mellea TaxID=50990 RepID=A0A4Y7PTP4_9AGAM|nr:ribonuclease H-like protein [Rickenella mellea]
MATPQRNISAPGTATVRKGLLTPHNSFHESLSDTSSSNLNSEPRDLGCRSPPPKRRRSFVCKGENEAQNLGDELRALDAEAAYLEKRLNGVRAKAAEIRSFFVDVNLDGKTSSDVARPLTPVEETRATPPVASSSSLPCELGDERPEIPDNDNSSYFVWFDLETTDAIRPFEETRILEVAVRITDKNFIPVDRGLSYLVHWPESIDEIIKEMPEVVRTMHETSGLINQYSERPEKKRLNLENVEDRVCAYLKRHGLEYSAVMAGAGVSFDRRMVVSSAQWMKKLDKMLSYQVFDTTTIWHMVRRRYNRHPSKRFKGKCAHRAMDDINDSIREAKIYADLVFKKPKDLKWPAMYKDGI